MSNDNDRRKPSANDERRRGSAGRGGTNSAQQNQTSQARDRTPGKGRTPNNAGPAKRKKKKNSQGRYIIFYVITLIVAVIVCLAAFYFVLTNPLSSNREPSTGRPAGSAGAESTAPNDDDDDDDNGDAPVITIDEVSLTGIVVNINQANRSLEILDFDSVQTLNFRTDNATAMQNRAGENMSFSQFRVGDIVDARYREPENPLISVNVAADSWEHRNVDNVQVNTVNSTMIVGTSIYRFSERTVSLFNNAPHNVADIHPLNVVTLRGIGHDIWFVEVSRGTGFINIINGESIRDGVIEIDGNFTVSLNADGSTDEPIRVQTGNNRIVVRGSNIETFQTTLDVSMGEQAILNLANVQVIAGVVTFNISEPGATVMVGGVARSATEPLILNYGSHTLVVSREGFVTYETVFMLDQPALELEIRLEPEVATELLTVVTTHAGTNEPLPGARVYVNSTFVGVTPVSAPVPIQEGTRMLSIRKDGFMSMDFVIDSDLHYNIALHELAPVLP